MASRPAQARSIYRRLLRELPSRSPSLLANPSPLQGHIRADLAGASADQGGAAAPTKSPSQRFDEAEQYIHYLRAQRIYTALLERYNPGMNLAEEDRIRMTARRVGMELPVEAMQDGKGGKKGD